MPVAGILAIFLHAAAATAAANPVNRPVVQIAVEPEANAAIDRPALIEMAKQAHEIWRPYVDISFELADEAMRSSAPLRLVVTDRTSPSADPASLGWIEFVDGRPLNVLTVSTTAARSLLKGSRWGAMPPMVQRTFLVRALARAVAHELGHYLLASRSHAGHGLMRGQLTADDIMQPQRSSVRLERADEQRLRQGVLLALQNNGLTAAQN